MTGTHFHRYKIYIYIFISTGWLLWRLFLLIIVTQLCPKFDNIWKKGPQVFPEDECREDRGRFESFAKEGDLTL